jgi:hypothetical protein
MTDRLRIIVDDILVTIKQTFDDRQVSQPQVAYWVILVGNQLLGQHNAKRDSGAFLATYTGVPVQKEAASSNPNIVKGRKFVELPAGIFDFDRDGGIEYIAYYNDDEKCDPEFRHKTIQRTTPSEVQWLMLKEQTKPSPKNPYWYRTGEIIYLLGIEAVPVNEIEMGIYQTINPLEKIDIDQPFPFPQELLHVLKRQVTDLARFSFLFPGTDRANDGNNEDATKNVSKIVSVNEQQANQE